ncbi:hypothetical protein FO519_006504 [Halicephalobus sp. NKZ332]|nr:hypothetical protein FO519_006504 [Halicephalobus sp. NKZ332]
MKKSPTPVPFSYIIPEFEVGTESIKIFESLLASLERILTQCVEMSEVDLKHPEISEEAKEALLVAAGHTRVLLKSKVKKMKQLIEKSKENTGEVTLNDLGSFWTMMDIEVSKTRDQFSLVEKYRENNWSKLPQLENVPEVNGNIPRTVTKQKSKITSKSENTSSANSTPRSRPNVKDFLAARRKELAESQKTEPTRNPEMALISTS